VRLNPNLLLAACALLLAGCPSMPRKGRYYTIQADLYEMPAELVHELADLDELGVELRSTVVLERVRMAARSRAGIATLSRTSFRTAAGVPCGISNLERSEWVQDYTVDAQWKSAPVKTEVLEGFEYELCPAQGEEGLHLQYRLKRTVLPRPVREVQITLSNGEQLKVHSLDLESKTLASSYELADDQILAAWLPGSKPGLVTLVCVRAELDPGHS